MGEDCVIAKVRLGGKSVPVSGKEASFVPWPKGPASQEGVP